MSDAITRGVHVHVESDYLDSESAPEHGRYVFTYHITIHNRGETPVQLLSRHWIITNAEGKVEEVRGAGVVGMQPLINPGETFSYSSFCPLDTPLGSMHGSYKMALPDKSEFDARIAPFTLSANMSLH